MSATATKGAVSESAIGFSVFSSSFLLGFSRAAFTNQIGSRRMAENDRQTRVPDPSTAEILSAGDCLDGFDVHGIPGLLRDVAFVLPRYHSHLEKAISE